MQIKQLDHLVLTVADIEATIDFYTRVLGMEVETSEQGRQALHFGEQKINLQQRGSEFDPKAEHPTPGSGDLCFLTEKSLDRVAAELRAKGVQIEEGPVDRTGARANLLSVYVRDPDQNLIEISNEMAGD